ncbi:division/cell wall cluster transcriptional repressor MraZ [Lacticaseibacillus porcinae]|uniref:division/cell wall cluster transcriptional repressor MraZ n=1 Tax=Lacticaseibacillus porcinae TaxID=1123687 RepID=UPI000F771D8B|nr:division/cell wall cluster transcriptional repressor MraZ [Lacticaseibacillus porcinae]
MLMGEFHHSIDTKGRLIVPAKFREVLNPSFVLTRGMDGCLFGYPQAEWQKLQEKLTALPLTKKSARTFSRMLLSGAAECELDKQGRINLPNNLIEHAALNKDCVLIGVSNRIEIWAAERWQKYADEAEDDFDELSENLIDFGL